MEVIKSFSLCIVLLSSFTIFPMEHECLAEVGNIAIENPMFGSVVQDNILQKIWDKIDRDYVKVGDSVMNRYPYLRPLVGSALSLCRAYCITPEQAKNVLWKIETDVALEINDKKYGKSILNELAVGHWYVQYLMQVLADRAVCTLEGVTGLNIDALHHNTHEELVQEIAFSKARTTVFDKNLGQKLIDIVPQTISDIHFTVLYHPHGNVNPDSLQMSDDDKYLQAKADNGVFAVWEMHTGEIIKASQIDVKQWNRVKTSYIDDNHQKRSLFGVYACESVERYRVVDTNDNYCAMMSDAYTSIDSEFLPKEAQNNPQAIIVFKRPQEVSYLCQKAFDNSYTSIKALQTLRDSAAMEAITGFPRKNLKRVIDNRIKALEVPVIK